MINFIIGLYVELICLKDKFLALNHQEKFIVLVGIGCAIGGMILCVISTHPELSDALHGKHYIVYAFMTLMMAIAGLILGLMFGLVILSFIPVIIIPFIKCVKKYISYTISLGRQHRN